jgi:putative Mg2+ transporter-C (MgtC) family protein
VEAFGDDAAKIEAKLASTSVDGEQMDALVARLGALQCIDQAYWSPSTTE